MDEQEGQRLLEEVDDIRVRSGLPRLDEASRRDFMKTLGKGAAAGAAMAAMPGAAKADTSKVVLQLVEIQHALKVFSTLYTTMRKVDPKTAIMIRDELGGKTPDDLIKILEEATKHIWRHPHHY